MARILIDGYNLLPVSDLRNREELILRLVEYRKARGHDITVVFDGTRGGTGQGSRNVTGGVEVIFTPLTTTADDFLEQMLSKKVGTGVLVVSSDRRIQSAARQAKALPVSSEDFARKISSFESEGSSQASSGQRESTQKLSKEERRRRRSLKGL